MINDHAREPIELHLTKDIIVKTLRLQEGNHVISNMKLTLGDKLLAFTMNNANDSVYASLRDDEICWVLQIHQQYFHIHQPQSYTHPYAHITYLFSLAILRKEHIKADWGMKILKDIKKIVQIRSSKRTRYIGNGVILT